MGSGGLNLYGYAGGDPVNFSDPFGLAADTIRPDTEDPRAAELDQAYENGRAHVAADANRREGACVLKSLRRMERSASVFLLVNGKVAGTGSQYGNCSQGKVTIDLDAIMRYTTVQCWGPAAPVAKSRGRSCVGTSRLVRTAAGYLSESRARSGSPAG